jgi:hypothetical protein
MTKWYGSFLLRCWHLDDDGQRLEIEHIQSGARTQAASITAALAWISARDQTVSSSETPAARPSDNRGK